MIAKSKFHFLFLMVSLAMLIVGCNPTKSESSPSNPLPESIENSWDDRSIFSSGLISSQQDLLNGFIDASIYHLDFQIADNSQSLQGWEEVHYTNREEVSLNEIYFQLFPNATGGKTTITSLSIDGHEVEPIYEFLDSALLVKLEAPLQPGDTVDIRMHFEVDVALEMGGNYGLFGYFDDILVLDEFYPVIPVYDDEGWNVQAPPPNADTSYFDIAFYQVRVTAPASLKIVASGIEIDQEQDGENQTVEFAAGPVRDFYMAASEQFVKVSQTAGETVINVYVKEDLRQGANATLQYAKDSIEIFSEQFGAYPYTEFDIVGTPMLAVGIEYPGIVGIVSAAFDPNETISGLPYPIMLEGATAHEVAHQWFYNIIGNDQIDEPWLDEAMAQFSSWLYYRDMYGESAANSYRDSWYLRWESVNRKEIPIGLAAAAYEGSEYSAIVYGRGPIFVQALADEMGQEAFDAFLKSYYEANKWEISTSESFKQTAESQCLCDLTALFDSWVYP